MIEINQNVKCERLYLQREDKNDIFLDNCQIIKQHQIEGLRFLFKQFKKNNPAAVVNFPPECGKSVTVALFLKAIHNLLKKPVLILCNNKNEIDTWKDTILQWTEYTNDDIAIESSNVYIKKKIFLKHLEDILPYQRRSWDILIIKDDLDKNTLKLVFDADFKIWMTSFDVKKDLNMLSLTYNWFTKGAMNAKDFLPIESTRKEKIEKAILLDSFLEDFVIQETRIEPLKLKKISDTSETKLNEEKSMKKSRKNKDASGTKIKRSKRVLGDHDMTEVNQNEAVSVNNYEILKENNDHLEINSPEIGIKIKRSKMVLEDDDITTEVNQNEAANVNNDAIFKENNDYLKINNSEKQFSFGAAVEDLVRNENVTSNKSTESFDESTSNISNTIICDEEFINDKEFDKKSDKCVDKCEIQADIVDNIGEMTENGTNFIDESDIRNVSLKSIEGMNVDEENELNIVETAKSDLVLHESIDIKETGTDLEIKTEGHKDIDTMISELEEKALKKFKGSLLDSIF
ncbi:unnamed protein product, partial [Brenthis ino]